MTRENLEKLAANPKAFLRSPADAEQKIKLKQAEIQRYHDIAVGITQTIKPVVTFTGEPGRKVEYCVAEIITLEEEISEALSSLYQKTVNAKEAIGYIKDPGQHNILWARYICRMPWSWVAETMECSERWVYRQHARALKELKRIAEEKLK